MEFNGSRYAARDALTGNRFCTLGSVAGNVEEDKRTKEEERERREETGGGSGESVQRWRNCVTWWLRRTKQ